MAFKGFLKQSTAVTLKVGPFVDSIDGNTVEAGLTITQAEVRLSKNGGNIAQKNESTSLTYDEVGMYDCPLDTTDTNTLGILSVIINEAGALLVEETYQVLSAAAWAAMHGDAIAEETAVPAANASLVTKINFMFAKARNKMTQTATTQLLRNDADNATIATSTVSDDGTTFTRGELA
jgi:hypothetical protein